MMKEKREMKRQFIKEEEKDLGNDKIKEFSILKTEEYQRLLIGMERFS